jgi:tRNA nucleotidyltransferase (CCA-adding enzyme)
MYQIQSNPMESMTGRPKVMVFDTDWKEYVNRMNLQEMGTVEEDAFRRDFTINAMYYNIHSREVEDVTKHGWVHLMSGVVRTPCEPLITLLDDPLRALRGIRFASRLHYAMAPELIEAAHDPRVSEALRCKISRERVGKEFEGMLSCTCNQ